MSNVQHLGNGIFDPKTMLLNLAEAADEFSEVVVIVDYKDGRGVDKYSTTKEYWFLFACACLMQSLAMDAVEGRIVDE